MIVSTKNKKGAVMAKRKRGRPALPEAERKRAGLTFRARDALRQRLADAAKQSGRSISEEIEFRLERSFLQDPMPENALKSLAEKTANDVVRLVTASIEATFSGPLSPAAKPVPDISAPPPWPKRENK
jgi:hypothetical protein